MIINKIKYLFVFIILIVFNTFYERYFPIVLLIISVILPVILIIQLIYMKSQISCDIQVKDEYCTENDQVEFIISINNKGILPISSADVVLTYKNDLENTIDTKTINVCADKKEEEKLNGKILVPNCGKLEIKLELIKIYDYLKIFKTKKRINISRSVFIYPKKKESQEIPFELSNITTDFMETYSETEPGDDPSEIFDIREYQIGDRLNRIHWKLSTKQDKLMVKEFSMPLGIEQIIFLETYDSNIIYKQIEDVFAISDALLNKNISHYIYYYDDKTKQLNKMIVNNILERDTAISKILNSKLTGNNERTLGYIEEYERKKIIYVTSCKEDVALNKDNFIVVLSDDVDNSKLELCDDLNFENKSKKVRKRNITYNILILIALVVGCIGTVIDCFDIEYSNIMYIFGLSFCTIFIITFLYKKYLKYTIKILSGIFILGLFVFRDILYNSLMYIINEIIQTVTEGSYTINYINSSIQIEYIETVMIFIMFLIIGFLAYATVYKSNFYIAFIISFLILEIGLFPGIIPPTFDFILIILAWIALMAIQVNDNRYEAEYSSIKDRYFILNSKYKVNIIEKSSRILTLIMITIFSVTLILFSQSVYDNSTLIPKLRSTIKDNCNAEKINDFIDRVVSGTAKGGVSGGDLGNVERIKYEDEVALKVYLSHESIEEYILMGESEEGMYLKGYVGGQYNGHGFEDVSDDLYNEHLESDYNYQNLSIDLDEECERAIEASSNDKEIAAVNNIEPTTADSFYYLAGSNIFANEKVGIVNVSANDDYAYLPYNADVSKNDKLKNNKDLYMIPDDDYKEYCIDFSGYSIAPYVDYNLLSEEIQKKREDYNSYVNKVYTMLPDDSLEKIKSDYGKFKGKEIYECVEKVVKDLQENTKYTLSPGKTPKDKDFVEYFLYENKKGYCSHYAAAATVMLRAMGVPTRYVAGYVVPADSIRKPTQENVKNSMQEKFNNTSSVDEIDVLDSSAHAWIEIFNGYGWEKIDVTPVADSEEEENNDDTIEENKTDSTSSTSSTSTEEDNKENQATQNKIEESKKEDIKTQEINEDEKVEDNTDGKDIINGILKYVLLSLLIIELIINKRSAALDRRRKLFNGRNKNKDVDMLYKHLLEIFKYLKYSQQENMSYKDYGAIIAKECDFINEEEFIEILEIVLKANYSDRIIEEGEYLRVKHFVRCFEDNVISKLSYMQKIYYMYIKNLG